MNFHELEEDVWIHYNNNYYFVFEIKFIETKTTNYGFQRLIFFQSTIEVTYVFSIYIRK